MVFFSKRLDLFKLSQIIINEEPIQCDLISWAILAIPTEIQSSQYYSYLIFVMLLNPVRHLTKYRSSPPKVFWKYTANLQENTNAEV